MIVATLRSFRQKLARLLPPQSPPRFGWHEAIAYGGMIDRWERYSAVFEAIEAVHDTRRALRILDIGPGGPGILAWRNSVPWLNDSTVVLLDLDAAHLPGDYPMSVFGAGQSLPFRTQSFDIALSIASLEHVPEAIRAPYVAEMRRVAQTVMILVPADSADGMYRGRAGDAEFQRWFTTRFGHPEANTAEHLQFPRHPDPANLLPDASVVPCQGVAEWLQVMTYDYSPWRQHIAGFRYVARHRGRRARPCPPYYSAIIVGRGHAGQ